MSVRVRWATLVISILALGVLPAAAQAKHKAHKNVSYFATVEATGQWKQSFNCGEPSYTSSWSMQALYRKTTLDVRGELDQTLGDASGAIEYTWDHYCNGSPQTGSCSVGFDSYILPVLFERARGGVKVDFQLSLLANCGDAYATVNPYGVGFDATPRTTHQPQGFIPSKKIGKKVIIVPISGDDAGTGPQRSFSGSMTGTLRLTRKRQVLPAPR